MYAFIFSVLVAGCRSFGGGTSVSSMDNVLESESDDEYPRTKILSKQIKSKTTAKLSSKRRPWTQEEINAIKKHLSGHLSMNKIPRQHEALKCKEAERIVLKHRTWKDIKYFVYNRVSKAKRSK